MTKINTYNETNLHKTLKELYAKETDGKTEQKVGSFICDIVSKKGEIIEIQTSNISSLKAKIKFLLDTNTDIRIVHPLIHQKIIETYSKDGILISRRKSPKKDSIYSVTRGLTGIYDLLTKNGLTLEILEVDVTEFRLKLDEKVQTANKSRRHLRDWISKGKRLDFIRSKKILKTKEDYLALLPSSLPQIFTLPDLKKEVLKMNFGEDFSPTNKKSATEKCGLLLWLLEKMQLVRRIGKKDGRTILYEKLSTSLTTS